MAADPRGSRDPLEQLRADRERHRAEERADAAPPPAVPPADWHHDTLELDLDQLRAASAPPVPPKVVGGSVLRSRTHGGAWRAVRRGSGAAARRVRQVRVPAGLVAGLVLLAGAGGASAVLGAESGPQTSQVQPSTTPTDGEAQSRTTTGDQPQDSVRVETEQSAAPGAPAPPGPRAEPRPQAPPGAGRGPGPGAGPAGGPPGSRARP